LEETLDLLFDRLLMTIFYSFLQNKIIYKSTTMRPRIYISAAIFHFFICMKQAIRYINTLYIVCNMQGVLAVFREGSVSV